MSKAMALICTSVSVARIFLSSFSLGSLSGSASPSWTSQFRNAWIERRWVLMDVFESFSESSAILSTRAALETPSVNALWNAFQALWCHLMVVGAGQPHEICG